jgi:hypothetical protein
MDENGVNQELSAARELRSTDGLHAKSGYEKGSGFSAVGMNLKHTTSKDEPLSYAKPSGRQVEVRQL